LRCSGHFKLAGKLLFQFIVTPEGENGLTVEHSPTDGVAVASMGDFIVAKIRNDQEQVFSPWLFQNCRGRISIELAFMIIAVLP
jgi:hypothetical protein